MFHLFLLHLQSPHLPVLHSSPRKRGEEANLMQRRRNLFGCLCLRNPARHSDRADRPVHEGACLRRRVLAEIVVEVHCAPSPSVRRASIRFPSLSGHTRGHAHTHTRASLLQRASIAKATRASFVLRPPVYRRYAATPRYAFTGIPFFSTASVARLRS